MDVRHPGGALSPAPWRVGPGHLVVRVRLTPRAGTDRIDGIRALSDGTAVLAARVRALPADGAANAAIATLIARAVGVARSAVTLAGGTTSRVKELRIDGNPATLAATMERLFRPDAPA